MLWGAPVPSVPSPGVRGYDAGLYPLRSAPNHSEVIFGRQTSYRTVSTHARRSTGATEGSGVWWSVLYVYVLFYVRLGGSFYLAAAAFSSCLRMLDALVRADSFFFHAFSLSLSSF